jgi:cobalamin biosynthesis Mg chelatase CobN
VSNNSSDDGKPDVEALREDIAQTRADLGETVQALAAKADVKARAKDSVEQTKQRVKAQAMHATDRVRATAAQTTEKVKATAAQTTDKVKATAAQTTDKVKATAAQTTDKVRSSGGHSSGDKATVVPVGGSAVPAYGVDGRSTSTQQAALQKVQATAMDARVRLQRNPVPAAAVLAGAALIVVLLIVRGRRR